MADCSSVGNIRILFPATPTTPERPEENPLIDRICGSGVSLPSHIIIQQTHLDAVSDCLREVPSQRGFPRACARNVNVLKESRRTPSFYTFRPQCVIVTVIPPTSSSVHGNPSPRLQYPPCIELRWSGGPHVVVSPPWTVIRKHSARSICRAAPHSMWHYGRARGPCGGAEGRASVSPAGPRPRHEHKHPSNPRSHTAGSSRRGRGAGRVAQRTRGNGPGRPPPRPPPRPLRGPPQPLGRPEAGTHSAAGA